MFLHKDNISKEIALLVSSINSCLGVNSQVQISSKAVLVVSIFRLGDRERPKFRSEVIVFIREFWGFAMGKFNDNRIVKRLLKG